MTEGVGGQPEESAVEAAVRKADEVRRGARNLQRAAAVAQGAVSALVTVVTNPITWVLVIVALFGVYAVGTYQVLGQNENPCAAGGSANGANVPTDLPLKDGQIDVEQMRNILGTWMMSTPLTHENKPFTKEQAGALIGNWQQESNLDPRVTQSGWCQGCTNEQILAAGASGGKAIGLLQWDTERKVSMVKFAQSKGKLWSDLQTQLEFFMEEHKSDPYETQMFKSALVAGGNDMHRLVDEFNCKVERSADCRGYPERRANRHKYADEFMKTFVGGASMPGGGGAGATACAQDAGMNTDNVAEFALSIALPTKAEAAVRGDSWGRNVAPQAYKDAKKKAMELGGADGMAELYASCDRFVATVIKNTVDKELPWGATATQYDYLRNSPKWKEVKFSEAKAGDIFITKGDGHIIIYGGIYQGNDPKFAQWKGKDIIIHASYLDRVGAVTPNYLKDVPIQSDGRAFTAFTFVG